MTQQNQTDQFLEARHPAYETRKPDWEFYLRSYIGGSQYLDGTNLFTHRLEHRTDAARRLARSYYLNHCRNVVDATTDLLFANGFDILPSPPGYFSTDADRRGNDLMQVLRRAAALSSIYGHVFLLVDVPLVAGNSPRTRREELALGIRPYLEIVVPTQVVNWEVDDGGAFVWCLVREDRGHDGSGDENVLRLWTRESWTLYEKSQHGWSATDQGNHQLGVVPMVSMRHRVLDGGVCGESLLRDVAVINREAYNLCSLLQEILYRQTFGQLVAQGSAEEYVGDDDSLAKLGSSSIFLYPEGRDAPAYISPNPANADILLGQIDRMVAEIYRISNLHPPDWLDRNAQAESGTARAYRYVNTSGALRDKADAVSDALEQALWFASLWEGNEREYTVTFPDRLGLPEDHRRE